MLFVIVLAGVIAAAAHTDLGAKWRARRLAAGLSTIPSWQPTWEVSKSTAFMPCNYSGFFNLEASSAYGLAGKEY